MNQYPNPERSKQCQKVINQRFRKTGNHRSNRNVKQSNGFKKGSENIEETNKIQQQIYQTQIISLQSIQDIIRFLRKTQYPTILQEDEAVVEFIQEEFQNFMKFFIGKVVHAALFQPQGSEFKTYQNKDLTKEQTLQQSELIKLQNYYGPEKNAMGDVVLCHNGQQQQQQQYYDYQIIDFTAMQRQQEYRRLLSDTETIQEQILINKIQSKRFGQEQSQQFKDILNKKYKYGKKLGDTISQFLCRNINQEIDQNIGQQKLREEADERNHQLKSEMYEQLKISEKYQQSYYKRQQQFKLENLEKQNSMIEVTITIQAIRYVLENLPYYQKSYILYKSYIL